MLAICSSVDCGLSSATKLPTPATRTMRPCSISSRSARLTVMRATPNFATSSLSEGRRWPAGQEPSWILWVMKDLTCSYSASAGCGGWALRAVVARTSAFISMLRSRHRLRTDLFGQARLDLHELGRGLDGVVARMREVDRDLALDAARPRA